MTEPTDRTVRSDQLATSGWVGWAIFAAVIMIILGIFHAIAGLVALFNADYYLVTRNGLVVNLNYTAWGWVHLILGVVVALAGFAVITGRVWGRMVGVVLASLSAIVNLAFLAAYPLWSTIFIAIDVLIIYALVVHGRELQPQSAHALEIAPPRQRVLPERPPPPA